MYIKAANIYQSETVYIRKMEITKTVLDAPCRKLEFDTHLQVTACRQNITNICPDILPLVSCQRNHQ